MASPLGSGPLPASAAKVNKTQSAPSHDYKGTPNLPNKERQKLVFDEGKAEPLPASEDKVSLAFVNGFFDELEKRAVSSDLLGAILGATAGHKAGIHWLGGGAAGLLGVRGVRKLLEVLKHRGYLPKDRPEQKAKK